MTSVFPRRSLRIAKRANNFSRIPCIISRSLFTEGNRSSSLTHWRKSLLYRSIRYFSSNSVPEAVVRQPTEMEASVPISAVASPSPYPPDSVAHQIFTKCLESLSPVHYLDIINESPGHSVPKGSETHFKVIIVSDKFQGLLPLQRHRTVYNLLKPLMRSDAIPEDQTNYHKIHALSIISKTNQEWNQEKERLLELSSPKCLGGSKR